MGMDFNHFYNPFYKEKTFFETEPVEHLRKKNRLHKNGSKNTRKRWEIFMPGLMRGCGFIPLRRQKRKTWISLH